MDEGRSEDFALALETAMEAGRIMLENGAEIYRTESTMEIIAESYGVSKESFFVLTNGLFATGSDEKKGKLFAKVQFIPVKGADLNKVAAVNALSRDVAKGTVPLEEARAKLREIREMKKRPKMVQAAAAGIGAGCFSALFGASLLDAAAAAAAGFLMYLFVVYVNEPHLSKVTGNLLAAALASFFCCLFQSFIPSPNLKAMIAGAVMPLIPGVPFVNGIRDIGGGDYISGTVRLLDALLVFASIASGVSAVLASYLAIFGRSII